MNKSGDHMTDFLNLIGNNPIILCLCSSVVEQGFCKAQVASSNLVEGFQPTKNK